MRVRIVSIILFLFISIILIPSVSNAEPFHFSWWIIDNGGGLCVGDDFQLYSSIGQHHTFTVEGGTFQITGLIVPAPETVDILLWELY
jgi:hypothetical protein